MLPILLEWIAWLQDGHVHWFLLAGGVILILIDYYFRTDAPAHFAYFAFGLVVFFVANLSLVPSIVAGLATWILLAILHRTIFYKYLHNTGPKAGASGSTDVATPVQPS